jgi:PAS domain S-box-containing protein
MNGDVPAPGSAPPDPPPAAVFRWQAFFQHAPEPLFWLNHNHVLIHVNSAWEALAGLTAEEAKGLACRRKRPAAPEDEPRKVLAHALCPPPEVAAGAPGRVRRLVPGRAAAQRWWDVEFFPLRGPGGKAGVLGRVRPVAGAETATAARLPERLMALRQRVAQRYGPELLTGAGPPMRRLADQVRLASRIPAPVLLVGEPGTGKRTLARVIHHLGPTCEHPFAALDCTRLPASAVAEVLFAGGPMATVYLKGPAHLPRELQQRLAALTAGAAEALPEAGGPRTLRVLAGCAAPREDVRAGRLLEELYYALGTLIIDVPPLRERLPDLPVLVDRLLQRAQPSRETPVRGLTPEAWDVLRQHRWPGNVRELYAALAEARTRAAGPLLGVADLPASLRLAQAPGPAPDRPLPLDHLLGQAERRLIRLALQRTHGHVQRAAELLGLTYHRLWRRMKALKMAATEETPPEITADDGGPD